MRLACLALLLIPAGPPDVPVPREIWKPLPPPERGEWRDRYPEKGQTLKEYKESAPTRPTEERTRIYLRPWITRPPFDREILRRIAVLLQASYGRKVAVLENGPLPARAYDKKRRQFAIAKLAAHLIRTLPEDALLVLAVTDRDVYVGGFHHVYGWGSFEWRVGVLSTCRIDAGPDPRLRRRRILAVALHEATHQLSVPHCIHYPCLMNGARSLDATDKRPMQLCPVCREKVCWNLGLDPLERYESVERALERVGLPGEAKRTRAALEATREHLR